MPKFFRLTLLLIPFLLLALLLSGPALAQSPPHFEAAECPVDVPFYATVECGYLTVPESRAQPNGRTIKLAVAIIKADSELITYPDPIVYLEGGPGGSALSALDVWAAKRFQTERDFILLDQRGTGFSEPNLSCPEVDELDVTSVQGMSEEEEQALLVETTRQCRDRLLNEGVNLSAYNSVENAADLNDLRLALGYPEWNLYGISYGTRLALEAMDNHPQGIRSVVIDGVYPPNVDFYADLPGNANRAVEQFFSGCAEDSLCNAEFPDLREKFFALVAQANEEPLSMNAFDVDSGDSFSLEMDGDDLLNLFYQALYDSDVITFLPLILSEASQGNYQPLATIWSALNSDQDFSTGMYFSVQCHEEVPFNDRTVVEANIARFPELGDLAEYESILTVCGIWRAGSAPSAENKAVTSDIPTLILSGQYDPITPHSWAQRAASTLSNSLSYEFPGLGHGTSVASDCSAQIASQFVNNPDLVPNTACLSQMTGPAFITDFYLTDAFFKLTVDMFVEANIPQIIIISLAIMVFLSVAFVWPIGLLIFYLSKRDEAAPPRSPWMLITGIALPLIALFNLGFIALALGIYFYTIFENEAWLLFGVPSWAGFLFIIPFFILLISIALLIFIVPVWRKKYWNIFARIHYSFMALASIMFVGLLWMWRFF